MTNIKTKLRRSGASVIGSTDRKVFFRTRFQLAILYAFITIAIIIVFNRVLGYNRAHEVRESLEGFPESEIVEVTTELEKDALFISMGAVVLTLIASYFLSGITLKPLKETIETQQRFIADASHQLRTPVSLIQTNLEIALMSKNELTPEEAINTIEETLQETARMTKLINNLLSLSRIKSDPKSAFTIVDFSTIVAKTVHRMQKLTLKKSINLSLATTNTKSTLIRGHENRLEEMLINLLENALTYTNPGGSVAVLINASSPNNVMVTIEDTGIGIPEEDLVHIFKPFFKARNTINNPHTHSAGLGLTIVKEIVETHGGCIQLSSKLGKGTVVTVILPTIKR